jgi:hypothetical protein
MKAVCPACGLSIWGDNPNHDSLVLFAEPPTIDDMCPECAGDTRHMRVTL